MQELPPAVISAISEQRAVLFLGAGASRGAQHPDGKRIPQGTELGELISDKFLAGRLKNKSLHTISALAANEVGLPAFQNYVRELLLPFEPSEHHLLIPSFRWRAIATTNFDLLVEKSYQKMENTQNLVVTVKDGDSFDQRMRSETDPVGFYKLHGCISKQADEAAPLVLTDEQYASYNKNRRRLYSRFRDLGHEYPIIFCGYSISDPHIQQILFDLTDGDLGRPQYYAVSPTYDDIEVRYWATHRVAALCCTFDDFLRALDHAVPSVSRTLPVEIGGGNLSIRKHYRVADADETRSLAMFLAEDVTHIHSGLTTEAQNSKQFYRGYDTGWGCILQNLDVRRAVNDSVLVDGILIEEESDQKANLLMLKGPGGNGKTVSLKRIAWEAGVSYDKLVLYAMMPPR